MYFIETYFKIWDTAGQERFRALRTPFYRGSDICFLSYAVNDKDSFQALIQWREEFIKYADVDADYFPFVVVGNKNDVGPAQRQVSQEEVAAWCQEFQIAASIETSAKNAVNIYEAFALAVKHWQKLERHTERELRNSSGDVIDLTRSVRLEEPSRFCCSGSNESPARRNSEYRQ
jgi:Ras-related protein Rab-9A